MGNMNVLSPLLSDAAVLGASSQVATLPIGNLQNYQPKKKWRSAGTTEWVTIDMGAAVACNALAVVGHNFTSAATFRLRGAASAAAVTASPVYDSGNVNVWPAGVMPTVTNWPQFTAWLASANVTALRYWRIDFIDPANPAGFLQAGRLVLGVNWRPSINFDVSGTPVAFDQNDVQTITDYGEIFTSKRAKSAARKFNVTISALDKLEVMNGIGDIQRQVGMWGDVIALLDESETTNFHWFTMQGVFTAPQAHQIVQQFTANGAMWQVNFPLREIP
jgi:hypothetical protein